MQEFLKPHSLGSDFVTVDSSHISDAHRVRCTPIGQPCQLRDEFPASHGPVAVPAWRGCQLQHRFRPDQPRKLELVFTDSHPSLAQNLK